MSEHPGCKQCSDKISELMAHMAAAEKEHESFRRRLNEHDDGLKKLTELTIAVKGMTTAISNQTEAMGKMEKRLAAIESAPGENWKKIAYEVVKYFVLALCAIALKKA